jgi:hypothetical protein
MNTPVIPASRSDSIAAGTEMIKQIVKTGSTFRETAVLLPQFSALKQKGKSGLMKQLSFVHRIF